MEGRLAGRGISKDDGELFCYTEDMIASSIRVLRQPIKRSELVPIAQERFGDMVKAVVDVQKSIMAVGGEMHADEESLLLGEGSKQEHLWGINLYPDRHDDSWIEFDSMINLRPGQGNRSRGVDDPALQQRIVSVVKQLVHE